MKKVLVIAGPTGSGKTAFAVACAEQFGGEIISGDSIQVYRGLDIGSGKVRPAETHGIPHHLIDIRDPREPYSVADFQTMARALIEQLDFPIIAGGTGLYLKACLYDYEFIRDHEEGPFDPSLLALSDEELYRLLVRTDPRQAEKIHPANRRRILRSLTIFRRTGQRQSEIVARQDHQPIYDIFTVGCTMAREDLYDRINARVEQMFRDGLEQEVRGLLAAGYSFRDPGLQGIGYREFAPYLAGEVSLEQTRAEIQKHSRQYAKRQYTWLNHQMDVHWFTATDPQDRDRMMEEIRQWKRQNCSA